VLPACVNSAYRSLGCPRGVLLFCVSVLSCRRSSVFKAEDHAA
jgi:hypothetical protein